MTKRLVLFATAAAVIVFAAGSIARAQQSRPYGEGGPMYQAPQLTSVNNPYSDYPATEVQAIPAARARAAIAHMEYLRAQAELNRGTRAAVRAFENSEDMSKATAEQTAAYERYKAARERALQPLQNDVEYQTLQDLKKRLAAQIAEKHQQEATSSADAKSVAHKPVVHEILALAAVKLRYAASATNREAELLRQSNEVREARTQLASAADQVSNMRTRFANDLRDDPDLIAARRAVWDQRIAHVASRVYLSGLYESRNIALDYAFYSRRYNPYRVAGYYDPYGFSGSYYGYSSGYRY